MSKRKSRSNWEREKFRAEDRAFRMTVHQRNEENQEPTFPVASPSGKTTWREMDNDSSSWDRNSRATSSSWPGDMEEAATRKILQLWEAIEKNLFGEIDVNSLEPVSNECNQWRTQLTHLRIIGKSVNATTSLNSNNSNFRSNATRSNTDEQTLDDATIEDSLQEYKLRGSNGVTKFSNNAENQNEVFERIFDFVAAELANREETKNVVELSSELDDVLRITPAPTYSDGKTAKIRGKRRVSAGSGKTSATKNRSDVVGTANGGRSNDRTFSATSGKLRENSVESDAGHVNSLDEDATPVARNKLGTVFNEKIVVSPVPFVVSQRESFTTLRTTPISFRAQTFEHSTSQGLGRYMNSACRTNSGHRVSGFRMVQSHSAWQVPVCPTVWPKNIRLAPIDPARLPSSKNRTSFDSPAMPRRNRNSLSPISRPPRPPPSAGPRVDHNGEGLEIHGKQIATRSRKHNHLKTGSPRTAKSSRTKNRTQKR